MLVSRSVTTKQRLLAEINGGYSVQSGVFGAINPRIATLMTPLGQYEAAIDPETLTDDELVELARVSAMSNDEVDESDVADALFSGVPGIAHDELVGYYSGLFAGFVVSGDYRSRGSSGGVTTWLLTQLLERGMVDGVIHARAGSEGDEVKFRYAISNTPDEVREGSKSRYYPLDLSEVLRAAKRSGGRYAVTGIPSFVMELRLLALLDAEFRAAIKFVIGLICGHQKSAKYAEAIAWERGIRPGDLRTVDFRKKIEGKSADEYITELRGKIGDEDVVLTCEAGDVFVSSWSHGFFKAKFSDFTDDLFNETADVALGDAWLPKYSSDHRGTNLVIVRNPEIASVITDGVESGELELEPLDVDSVIRSQPGLVRHAHDELPYRLHRADQRHEWRPLKRVEASPDLPLLRRRIQDVREQIAEQSHIHYRTAVELGDWSYFVAKMKPLVDRHNALYSLTDAKRILRKGPVHFIRRAVREIRRRIVPRSRS